MAAYPSYPIAASSRPSRVDGLVGVRATDGTLKVRKTMTNEKMEFSLVHELTSTQRDGLESHYQGDKLNSFNFTWPTTGSTYSVRYLSSPLFVEQLSGWYKAYVKLGEV